METSDRGVLDVERFDLEPDRPLFHGLLGDMDFERLAGLSTAEKSPFVIRLLGANDVSARGAASMFELGSTVTGWPQLASEVTLGAVTVAAAVRRFGLGGDLHRVACALTSKRFFRRSRRSTCRREAEDQLRLPPPTIRRPTSDDPIEFIVDAARRAPSGGNVQPWRFEADHDEIRFFVVPERSTSSMDVHLRGATSPSARHSLTRASPRPRSRSSARLSCFPSGTNSDHVATLHLGNAGRRGHRSTSALGAHEGGESSLRPARRRSTTPTIAQLARGVEREGARLRFATDRDQHRRVRQAARRSPIDCAF